MTLLKHKAIQYTEIMEKIRIVRNPTEFFEAVEEIALIKLKQDGCSGNNLFIFKGTNEILAIQDIPMTGSKMERDVTIGVLKSVLETYNPKALALAFEGTAINKTTEKETDVFCISCFDLVDKWTIIYDVIHGEGKEMVWKRRPEVVKNFDAKYKPFKF